MRILLTQMLSGSGVFLLTRNWEWAGYASMVAPYLVVRWAERSKRMSDTGATLTVTAAMTAVITAFFCIVVGLSYGTPDEGKVVFACMVMLVLGLLLCWVVSLDFADREPSATLFLMLWPVTGVVVGTALLMYREGVKVRL
ncbi:MAG TPA: hypothetical protein VM103_01030 [Candidatus Paceibacterota bacterium]|nr:hypothetical protein [Candidatus Paceibacterota bacterium]